MRRCRAAWQITVQALRCGEDEMKTTLLKYILPLGCLFAVALCCSNLAYLYSSVAFLQFCKEGNVALIFAMSCLLGLQVFSWHKVAILSVVVAGCSLCAHGDLAKVADSKIQRAVEVLLLPWILGWWLHVVASADQVK
eukprot:Skav232637  [mRNA]  locus=scaffold12:235642:238738:+ [translate_table: standard]